MNRKFLCSLLSAFTFFFFTLSLSAQVEPLILNKASRDEQCRQWVDSVFNTLSLKERVGQLFVYTIAPVQTRQNEALLRDAVKTYKVGGLLFSGGLMENQAQLTNKAQEMASVPVMITFDGEWGLSMRLRNTPIFPRNMILGCIQDDRLIYEYGQEVARQSREMGVHVNFAPVADVNINPRNPVINTRSFGEDPERVADKVIAYSTGLESGGVLSVSKHFPGHGDTDVDSHHALPVLPFSRERLDSVELYPFRQMIRAGLGSVMVGHLEVPALEPEAGRPSSLSRNIVHGLLKEEMGFRGLIFTDALAMKGAGNENPSLQALKAGNDMVLSPPRLKSEIEAVLKAIEKGELSEAEINEKCRKVLIYKYMLGLPDQPEIQLSGLEQRIHTPQATDLIRRLQQAAVTLIVNKDRVLPLDVQEEESVAVLQVGGASDAETFIRSLEQYAPVRRFQLAGGLSASASDQLIQRMKACKRIVVCVTATQLTAYQTFFDRFEWDEPVTYVFFTPNKPMTQIETALSKASAVIWAHSINRDVQRHTADALFGQATLDGRLSASVGSLFRPGQGVTLTVGELPVYLPEEYGMNPAVLDRIDEIALEGISKDAYPGCQVVVLKEGKMMYNKAFGTHAGKGSAQVEREDMYDVASLSKMVGTLLAVMKVYDKGLFNLTDKVSDHLPYLKGTNKENITIRELLFHESGLVSSIPFYREGIDTDSYPGTLLSAKRDATHPLQLASRVWANPHFSFRKGLVSPVRTDTHTLHVVDSMWVDRSFQAEINRKIVSSRLGEKKYVYSCIGFILLQQMVEQLTGTPLDTFLAREFFDPMGLRRTSYLPLRYFEKEEIVPSAIDRFVRKTTIHGYVHDEAAAFQGGISGNAGLFSTATEVAQISQLLLNGGEYRGKRYLGEETCRLFTTGTSSRSRRGLGFDKPDRRNPERSPCAAAAPASVYGHTGFTGTCVWVDPDNELVYVFLSNRTYPSTVTNQLSKLGIRKRIQEVIYQSLEKKEGA
ncbi:MAG: serine hydrolase [Bacteroides sp.]|nr:serine hydrolase [Bacteroides sp.]